MKENKEPTHWLWKYVAAILFFAAAVNGAMCLPIPTLSTLTSGDWLGFWGGYLGGVIGCIPAIAALLHSQAEAKRLHEETAEAQRRSVMPMFTVDLTLVPPSSTNEEVELCSECIALNPDGTLTRKTPLSSLQSLTFMFNHRQSHLPYLCCLKNIGLGPVSDFYIIPSTCADPQGPKVPFDPCGIGGGICFALCLPRKTTSTVLLFFSDILGNKYSQSFKLVYTASDDTYRHITISVPTLIKPE